MAILIEMISSHAVKPKQGHTWLSIWDPMNNAIRFNYSEYITTWDFYDTAAYFVICFVAICVFVNYNGTRIHISPAKWGDFRLSDLDLEFD